MGHRIKMNREAQNGVVTRMNKGKICGKDVNTKMSQQKNNILHCVIINRLDGSSTLPSSRHKTCKMKTELEIYIETYEMWRCNYERKTQEYSILTVVIDDLRTMLKFAIIDEQQT